MSTRAQDLRALVVRALGFYSNMPDHKRDLSMIALLTIASTLRDAQLLEFFDGLGAETIETLTKQIDAHEKLAAELEKEIN